ncbi:MAG: PASTA domain-containing protein [Planctomycetes bacterium]|nr:PASTA domain-containing protein [Planctomycetota bacterium]
MVPIGNTVLLRISSGLPDITTLLEGASAGNFVNPIGPSGMVTTGVGTNNFTWGDSGIGGTGPSSLVFAGDTIYTTPEEEFVIGTLSYFNGTIMLSTEAKTVDLKVDLDFTNPDGISQEFIYQLQLINSRNTGHPDESADMVLLPNIYPGNIITVDGMLYTLKLTFGDVVSNDNGVSKTDRFFVHEGESAVAELRGIITTCNVSKPAPNVVAMPLDEAERVITRAGLKVGDVTTVKSCSVPAGTVISQIPAAGVIVTAGSTLDLIIASAPEIVNDKFPPYGSGDTNTAYDSLPCISEAPSGTLTIGIWFANTSQDTLCSLYFMVNDISGGNLLCNADDGSGSIGSTLIVTLQGDLEDGLLAPGESFYVEFKVGLASMNQFDFWVDLFGVVTE